MESISSRGCASGDPPVFWKVENSGKEGGKHINYVSTDHMYRIGSEGYESYTQLHTVHRAY